MNNAILSAMLFGMAAAGFFLMFTFVWVEIIHRIFGYSVAGMTILLIPYIVGLLFVMRFNLT